MYNMLVAFYVLLASCVMSSAGYMQEVRSPMLLVIAILCGGGAIGLARKAGPVLVQHQRSKASTSVIKRAINVSLFLFFIAILTMFSMTLKGMLFLSDRIVELLLYGVAALMTIAIAIPLVCGLLDDLRIRRM